MPDEAGIEAPREAWRSGPHIRVVIDRTNASEQSVEATLSSLHGQTYKGWSVAFAEPALEGGEAGADSLLAGLQANDFVTPLRSGDSLPPYALAAVVQHALNHPEADLLYGDEESVDDRGRYVRPQLKPDWSPTLQGACPYVDRAVYFRVWTITAEGGPLAGDLAQADRLWDLVYSRSRSVRHIRRILLTKVMSGESNRPPDVSEPGHPFVKGASASITVIIPTRDRPDLLGPCVASLHDLQAAELKVLIADNGSKRASTHSLYQSLSSDRRVRVLALPGPFNFSAICNQAAAMADGQVLVFLNDDTLAVQPNWVMRLADWALRPDCGAIGAKLLYPSGRVQHGGLVVGLGGYAAHIEAGAATGDPGYLGRLAAAHEVSAVTGACLAVEKAKFESVNGFDAERFPVELGDVDLCLRLEARGWKTVLAAETVLIHRESASRGRARDREIRYAQEHRHFAARWQARIRDDPFFHPALSLNSLRTRLDG